MTLPELISDLLRSDRKVRFRAPGNSMYPTVRSDETLLVEPIKASNVKPGEIILYRRQDYIIAHRVVYILSGNSFINQIPEGCIPKEKLRFILRGDAAPYNDDPVEANNTGPSLNAWHNCRNFTYRCHVFYAACKKTANNALVHVRVADSHLATRSQESHA